MEQEVTAFLKACVSDLTTLSGGMMEAEAVDPQNVDMEGMEDSEDEAYMEKNTDNGKSSRNMSAPCRRTERRTHSMS